MMLTAKYRPSQLEDFIGNAHVVQPFIQWLLEWNCNNTKSRCALVSGVNGVGKSLLVDLILNKYDYNIINLSVDDERDKGTINDIIKPMLRANITVSGQKNCLVVSDIDSVGDHGFISTLTECIKCTFIPIICICDDRYSQTIKPILNYCVDFKLSKPTYVEIYKFICKIATAEQITIDKTNANKLYREANGDIRFILNSIQLGINRGDYHKDIQSSNIFDTTGYLLSQENSMDNKLQYYWMSADIHTLMVQENYINNTLPARNDIERLENISYSADSLSDADIFDNFKVTPIYAAINTIKAASKCDKKGFGSIKFTQFLGKTAIMNKNKRDKINYEVSLSNKNTSKEPNPKKTKEPKTPKPKTTKKPKAPKTSPTSG